MFGAINILGMGVFSLLIPETKGRSLEEMDIIFGSVQAEKREADIAQEEKGELTGTALYTKHANVRSLDSIQRR